MGQLGPAAGVFAVTNVDDLVLLALFFAKAAGERGGAVRVVAGQYLGFAAILAVSICGALGADLLPERMIPWLGLLPLLIGLRAGWLAWRGRHAEDDAPPADRVAILSVAGVTVANGGDNVGVYVPVFAAAGTRELVVYAVVFLALVAVWCGAGRFLATRPPIARVLARWGHVVLPVVLIGIGLLILCTPVH
ncbi:cadmium resistance transporter [Amycolatopsis sp. NPDC059027]|uniref:cadmium resistance transporter n=1 Tax=unclassified Amycolatopsis TaxID=2618356 RepID=UPI00366A611C